MNVLHSIEDMGFKITWKLIALGLHGFKNVSGLVSRDELFAYLVDCLGRNTMQTDNIIRLICEKENDFTIDHLLCSFATEDGSIESVQCRKWKAYILKKLLSEENDDYFQGLLSLMEFWALLGGIENCPHDFPDNTKISVQDYFTEAKYKDFLEKNCVWLENEVRHITQLEFDIDSLQ